MNAPRPKRHDRDALMTKVLFIAASVAVVIALAALAWALVQLPSIR